MKCDETSGNQSIKNQIAFPIVTKITKNQLVSLESVLYNSHLIELTVLNVILIKCKKNDGA